MLTIELDSGMFTAASNRFRVWPTVSVLQGDSATVIQQLLSKPPFKHGVTSGTAASDVSPRALSGAQTGSGAMFFLDGHFSGAGTAFGADGETPVLAELRAILSWEKLRDWEGVCGQRKSVIVIDDARHFTGSHGGYPSLVSIIYQTPKPSY